MGLDSLWAFPIYLLVALAGIFYFRRLRNRPYQPTRLQRFTKRFAKPS